MSFGSSASGWAVDTFLILESSGAVISDPLRLQEIQGELEAALAHPDKLPKVVPRHMPRRLRHFPVPLEVTRTDEPLEIVASDSPGLLAKIGRAFVECELRVHNARITTIGERAEDLFFVSDTNNQPLHDERDVERLHAAISRQLSSKE